MKIERIMTEPSGKFRPIEAMSIDELLAEKVVVDKEIGRIRLQLDEARARVITSGEYSDPHWFARARGALRMFGNRSQSIQRRIGQVRREEKSRNVERSRSDGERFKHVFMRLVRERLGDSEYQALCDLANCEVAATTERSGP